MRVIAGAYATAPRPLQSDVQFRHYVDQIIATPGIDGLEVPFYMTESPWGSVDYLAASPSDQRHVLTLVPAFVIGMGEQPLMGLASTDEESRASAVALARSAHEYVQRVNSAGGGSFDTIELHSTPRRADGSVDALERSLDEIRTWDWSGVELAIEHCDTDTGTHAPAKGYLPLDQELDAIAPRGGGVVINWGRSAIETRSADGPADHIAATAARGALTGVIFSGVSPVDNVLGAAWADSHAAFSGWGTSSLAAESDASLLTAAELDRCVRLALAAPELRFLGLKVAPPPAASDEERVELLRANLAMLLRAIEGAGA
ncbi:DUF4862 family protein [soil metagenome]